MQNFDYFRLDGHTLRVFVSVCETGSLSHTARLFRVNQSTISHTIEKLRAALQDPLFVKVGRGITPTEKAIAVLPRVKTILADIEGLVAAVDYDAALDTRPVVLAIPSPALLFQMRQLWHAMHQVSQALRLEIKRLAPSSRVEEMLTEEMAEVAIAVAGETYPTTLSSCPYFSEDLAVFYDPACRGPVTSLEDYAKASHGMVEFGGGQNSMVEKTLVGLGVDRHLALVAPTTSMLGDLIAGTDIIVTMPLSLSASVYKGLSHCPVPFAIPPIRYDLVWHRRYQNSGRNAWLRELILDTAPEGHAGAS
ncbi:MAG: LysR family transcriptional regulator [Pseudomonadota bacterium]